MSERASAPGDADKRKEWVTQAAVRYALGHSKLGEFIEEVVEVAGLLRSTTPSAAPADVEVFESHQPWKIPDLHVPVETAGGESDALRAQFGPSCATQMEADRESDALRRALEAIRTVAASRCCSGNELHTYGVIYRIAGAALAGTPSPSMPYCENCGTHYLPENARYHTRAFHAAAGICAAPQDTREAPASTEEATNGER